MQWLISLITVLLHCATLPASVYSAHSLRFLFSFLSCSLHHVPSMHHSPSVHFCCCTLHPSSHLNHTQQKHPFLLCSTFLYSLCTMCMQSASFSCMLFRPISSTLGCFFHFTLPQLSHLLCATLSLFVLHLLLIVSALPDHHGNSSASLVVSPTHPSSLGVISRFLSFSGS
jgi:hypothetical protein